MAEPADVPDGITGQFRRLCELQLPHTARASLTQPRVPRQTAATRLKRKLYDTLFDFLKQRPAAITSQRKTLADVKSEIWWYVLRLRRDRKFDEGHRLEQLFVTATENSKCQEDIVYVLLFLLELKDTSPAADKPVVGHAEHRLPVLPKRDEVPLLPSGPLCYGDTLMVQPDTIYYMHYPRRVFEAEPLPGADSITDLCDQCPGSGLAASRFFSVQGYLQDRHEQVSSDSLFGALVQGRVTSIDARLDIPDLPEECDSSLLETRIPKSHSVYSIESNDEGFKSQEESVRSTSPDISVMECSVDSVFQADYDTSIYDECLTQQHSAHYTWETIGLGPGARTKPYLSEAGPRAFDYWHAGMLESLKTAFPSIYVAPRVEVSQGALVKEILNVLIAVPSVNFMLDLTDQCFSMREGVCVSGISAEVLAQYLDDFLTCGMYYYRLDQFSSTRVQSSLHPVGLTLRAYMGAVRRVLHHYCAAVLSVPEARTLLQLRVSCHRLLTEIRLLARLCRCDDPVTQETMDNFPSGVALLSYVYRHTLEASFTDHYPMLLSILKTTCTPYLLFVQSWVFHGVFRDSYDEFMVEVHDDYLTARDKSYWSHGYTLTSASVMESVPMFLKDLANDIFICGKSINLLKTCNPRHFLCEADEQGLPRVCLTFSAGELRDITRQFTAYSARMQQVARQAAISREEAVVQAEQAKRDVKLRARRVATQELQRLEDRVAELRRVAQTRKQKQLDFLKQQMEDDLHRRSDERDQQRQEDRDYMDKLVRRETAIDVEQAELERQAREEIERYYGQLTEEAAHREHKAMWRVRRARLDIARSEFLRQQEQQWAADMERASTDPSSVVSDTPVHVYPASVSTGSLPGWAQRGLEGPTQEVEGETEAGTLDDGGPEVALPKWAQMRLKKYGMSLPDKLPSPTSKLRPSTPVRKKLADSFSVSHESEEQAQKSSIQTYEHAHASKESQWSPVDSRPQIRIVASRQASTETSAEEEITRPHIKQVGGLHATMESSAEVGTRPHLKTVTDKHANLESEEQEFINVPRLKHGVTHSGTETESHEWKIKQQSQFGHVSQQTTSRELSTVPKLKRSSFMSATKESDFMDYSIKSTIRFNKRQMASTESTEQEEFKSRIKFNPKMSATTESEFVDVDKLRTTMFKERNVYGHSGDSTVQSLLYPILSETGDDSSVRDGRVVTPESLVWMDSHVEPYQDNFDFLNKPPAVDLMSGLPGVLYGGIGDYDSGVYDGEVEGYTYLPLPAIVQASVTRALTAQISLVNESIVKYFMSELQINDHFHALRRYLCMGDGDFSEILCDLLMEKLATNPRPQDVLNPMFLNNALNKAIRLSTNAEDKYADNLSFTLEYFPRTFQVMAPDSLNCLQLYYSVKWPLNIVITKNSLHKYRLVFTFMLQLKRVVWVLKDIWHRLKRDALVHRAGMAVQFRQLHLYRQEMQHFVKVMQGYISYQIVDVTWQEFQQALAKDVHNLDDLHNVHCQYLDNAIFRCLLTKNATSLMKIIQDIFGLILKFHRQLVSGTWHTSPPAPAPAHSNFTNMVSTYRAFLEYSGFLFKVVSKLAFRGYQPHLHDLLLRLNFNNYYSAQ